MRLFHAHFYFENHQIEQINKILALAKTSPLFHVIEFFEKPIGPHPTPTFEVHFYETVDAEARTWLREHRGPFSVLIHEETGNDVLDHSQNIEWMGAPHTLDFGFFDLILKHPELRVHPIKT